MVDINHRGDLGNINSYEVFCLGKTDEKEELIREGKKNDIPWGFGFADPLSFSGTRFVGLSMNSSIIKSL